MATKKTTAAAATAKPRNKTEILSGIADTTGLSRKQVASVFDAMTDMMKKDLSKRGPGAFAVPGLMKVQVQTKPATKGGKRPNPFKPGEMMEVKPKPARRIVKVRPLKSLKEMV